MRPAGEDRVGVVTTHRRGLRRSSASRTDHVESDPPRLASRWALFSPLLWLLNLAIDRPTCLVCLGRDDGQADDD
jgi:hypothetical protein